MNFSDILKTAPKEIERPPLPPVGTYVFDVIKYEFKSYDKKDGTGKWEVIEFILRANAPSDGVDEDALAEFGNVNRIIQRKTFMGDGGDESSMKETAFRVKDFCEKHLGMDVEGFDSWAEMIGGAIGQQCLGTLKLEPRRDDQSTFQATLAQTAPLD